MCLTTWGERPKRQVSIKTDRDYVTSGDKSVAIGVVSVTKPPLRSAGLEERPVEQERRPRTSVYKSMETGNTKAIKHSPPDPGRLPIVRSVELKKQPTTAEQNSPPQPAFFWNVELKKQPVASTADPQKSLPENHFLRIVDLKKAAPLEEPKKPSENDFKTVEIKKQASESSFFEKNVRRQTSELQPKPVENGFSSGSENPFGLTLKSSRPESRQIKPPSYLFGFEPKVNIYTYLLYVPS